MVLDILPVLDIDLAQIAEVGDSVQNIGEQQRRGRMLWLLERGGNSLDYVH